jgi:predicted acetyltransferase
MSPLILDGWKYRLPVGRDDKVSLRLVSVEKNVPQLGSVLSLNYEIVDLKTKKAAGRIGLRIGDSEALFYLGHVGYSVKPEFRGNGYAYRACRRCLPLFQKQGMGSVCITTDEGNVASIRTCEKLGCRYESTVEVPRWCRQLFEISERKRRYILVLR